MSDVDLVKKYADEISKANDCDVLLINGDMYGKLQHAVLQAIKDRPNKKKSLFFILTTPGGLPECAYRITRAIQDNYESATAIVAGWCKSAGTLCVIGAKEIVMFDAAELGPLDVQIARRDELGERDSGLVLSEALLNLEQHAYSLFETFLVKIKMDSDGAITFKTATEISSAITKGLFEPIYRQIDPNKMGEAARLLAIADAYGKRLNLWSKNLKPTALKSLASGYPSHGFVIDRREATELFKNIREPNANELALISKLGKIAEDPGREPSVIYLNSQEKTHEATAKTNAQSGGIKKTTGANKASGRARKPKGNSQSGA